MELNHQNHTIHIDSDPLNRPITPEATELNGYSNEVFDENRPVSPAVTLDVEEPINRSVSPALSAASRYRTRRAVTDTNAESFTIPIEDEPDAAGGKVTQRQTNTYAAKKTVAQGMMDIALITANANQLRYIIEFNQASSTYSVIVGLIVISLLLQVGVGVALIFKGGLDLKGKSKHRYARRINNYVVSCIFLVTIINVFVASFTTTGPSPGAVNTIYVDPNNNGQIMPSG